MESAAYTSFSDIVGHSEVQSALEVLGDIVEDIYGKVAISVPVESLPSSFLLTLLQRKLSSDGF